MIQVRFLHGDEYEVKVAGRNETIHRVTLGESDPRRLVGDKISAEKLIEESFHFLLEREPNISILAAFDRPILPRI
jgi:hypothetical protein